MPISSAENDRIYCVPAAKRDGTCRVVAQSVLGRAMFDQQIPPALAIRLRAQHDLETTPRESMI